MPWLQRPEAAKVRRELDTCPVTVPGGGGCISAEHLGPCARKTGETIFNVPFPPAWRRKSQPLEDEVKGHHEQRKGAGIGLAPRTRWEAR